MQQRVRARATELKELSQSQNYKIHATKFLYIYIYNIAILLTAIIIKSYYYRHTYMILDSKINTRYINTHVLNMYIYIYA